MFFVNNSGNLTLNTLSVRNGRCNGSCAVVTDSGAGILNFGTLSVRNSIVSGNSANALGGGISNLGTLSVVSTTVSSNSANTGGGGISNSNSLTVLNSTFLTNTTTGGGAAITNGSALLVNNSTFSGNSANVSGGAIDQFSSSSTASVINSTFSGNSAGIFGGGISNVAGTTLLLTNSTLAGNSAAGPGAAGGGVYKAAGAGTVTLRNTIVANSTDGGNCSAGIANGGGNLDSGATCGWGTASGSRSNTDPKLGPLGNNGGPTSTMALLPGSPAVDAGITGACPVVDQRGTARPQGSRCDIGAYEKTELIFIEIGTGFRQSYSLASNQNLKLSYAGVNNGPVKFENTVPGQQLVASEQLVYNVNGVAASFSEIMGLPASQLGTVYWLPWYNNVGLNSELHIGNVSNSPASVRVFIGATEMAGSPFTLAARASVRKSFPGIDAGPVRVQSNVNIVVSERMIYKVNGVNTSFTEIMGMPASQLNNIYWLPWYNNIGLDTQLRFANVSTSTATVHVSIGGTAMPGSPFTLAPGASMRRSFPGVDAGPVRIQSNVNIVASERVIYKVNGVNTSFSEMMGLPNSLLNNNYWFPQYNNVALDTQLRIANVSSSTATIRVFVGGVEMTGSPFTLGAGASTRKSFPGVNGGPVRVQSNVSIVAAERVIYTVNGVNTSFTEMMGLPNSLLSTVYWAPLYNNVDLNTFLRFGVP